MEETNTKASAGYLLEGVFVIEQQYAQVDGSNLRDPATTRDRNVSLSWDWRPLGARRFEVMIEVSIEATKIAPEVARVRMIGVFEAVGDLPAISFQLFVTKNAVAILMPYAREVLSTMTGRGPHGAFHLNPVNVEELMKNVDLAVTSGNRFLDANPAVAANFGLDYRPSASVSAQIGETQTPAAQP